MVRTQNNKHNEDNRPPATPPTYVGQRKRTTEYASVKEVETEAAYIPKSKRNEITSSAIFQDDDNIKTSPNKSPPTDSSVKANWSTIQSARLFNKQWRHALQLKFVENPSGVLEFMEHFGNNARFGGQNNDNNNNSSDDDEGSLYSERPSSDYNDACYSASSLLRADVDDQTDSLMAQSAIRKEPTVKPIFGILDCLVRAGITPAWSKESDESLSVRSRHAPQFPQTKNSTSVIVEPLSALLLKMKLHRALATQSLTANT